MGSRDLGGVWGGFDHLFFSPPSLSTHPEQTGPVPCPGLNPFHQSDLREKHSFIPEKRSHIYRSSGNRRRLMKCRLTLRRKRELLNEVTEKTEKSTNCYVLACFSNPLVIRLLRCVFFFFPLFSVRKYN